MGCNQSQHYSDDSGDSVTDSCHDGINRTFNSKLSNKTPSNLNNLNNDSKFASIPCHTYWQHIDQNKSTKSQNIQSCTLPYEQKYKSKNVLVYKPKITKIPNKTNPTQVGGPGSHARVKSKDDFSLLMSSKYNFKNHQRRTSRNTYLSKYYQFDPRLPSIKDAEKQNDANIDDGFWDDLYLKNKKHSVSVSHSHQRNATYHAYGGDHCENEQNEDEDGHSRLSASESGIALEHDAADTCVILSDNNIIDTTLSLDGDHDDDDGTAHSDEDKSGMQHVNAAMYDALPCNPASIISISEMARSCSSSSIISNNLNRIDKVAFLQKILRNSKRKHEDKERINEQKEHKRRSIKVVDDNTIAINIAIPEIDAPIPEENENNITSSDSEQYNYDQPGQSSTDTDETSVECSKMNKFQAIVNKINSSNVDIARSTERPLIKEKVNPTMTFKDRMKMYQDSSVGIGLSAKQRLRKIKADRTIRDVDVFISHQRKEKVAILLSEYATKKAKQSADVTLLDATMKNVTKDNCLQKLEVLGIISYFYVPVNQFERWNHRNYIANMIDAGNENHDKYAKAPDKYIKMAIFTLLNSKILIQLAEKQKELFKTLVLFGIECCKLIYKINFNASNITNAFLDKILLILSKRSDVICAQNVALTEDRNIMFGPELFQIENNPISDRGIQMICNYVEKNALHLKCLKVGHCFATVSTRLCGAFCEGLQHNEHILKVTFDMRWAQHRQSVDKSLKQNYSKYRHKQNIYKKSLH